ncbi:MAG TPA: hypothetical protein VHS99_12865 [Chloroflexota bacterium]|nr:hypothetical protein [Chloroflexota bacterium]
MRPSTAPIELTLDLRSTPPDKVLSRLFGALERIGADVTLLVVLRDTPEYAGVVSSMYQVLHSHGYVSDSSRLPAGGQRIRVQRRRNAARPTRSSLAELTEPAPEPELDTTPPPAED